MVAQDICVGLISTSLGLFSLVSAVSNWEWFFQLRKMRWLEDRLGRTRARVTAGLLGCGLIVLGIAIALGFAPNKSAQRDGQSGRAETDVQNDAHDWTRRQSESSGASGRTRFAMSAVACSAVSSGFDHGSRCARRQPAPASGTAGSPHSSSGRSGSAS